MKGERFTAEEELGLSPPRRPQAPPLPFRLDGYGTIVADPPWLYRDLGSRFAPDYVGMPTAEIAALPVDQLVADRGYLFEWATSSHLADALEVMRAWGFRYVSSMVWVKTTRPKPEPHWRRMVEQLVDLVREPSTPRASAESACEASMIAAWSLGRGGAQRPRIGGGHHVRLAHEFVLIGERGGHTGLVRDVPSVVFAPAPAARPGQRRAHSAKPDEFMRIFERLAPGPRIELFARRPLEGWTVWGLESGGEAATDAARPAEVA